MEYLRFFCICLTKTIKFYFIELATDFTNNQTVYFVKEPHYLRTQPKLNITGIISPKMLRLHYRQAQNGYFFKLESKNNEDMSDEVKSFDKTRIQFRHRNVQNFFFSLDF